MESPPLQTMAQPSNYDPNRIPLSVFSTKVTNPQEWSVASNELFSIHMGNNSFSRDYEFLFGKSGELSKPEDWNAASQAYVLAKSGEIPRQEDVADSHKKPVKEDGGMNLEKTGIEMKHDDVQSSAGNGAKQEAAPSTSVPEAKKAYAASFPSPPRCSDESGNSVRSFAFPVLVNEGGKMSMSSESLNLKAIPEKPDQQPEPLQDQVEKETVSGDAGGRRCSLFSCWPHCC